jgi:hypothetical protein
VNQKLIVIAGAHSGVGKTQLARKLRDLFPGSVRIKIGHGKRKPDGDGVFYHIGTPVDTIRADYSHVETLIIESNSILKQITPALTIFLPGDPQREKPSAAIARQKADIIRGVQIDITRFNQVRRQGNFNDTQLRKILWHLKNPSHSQSISAGIMR